MKQKAILIGAGVAGPVLAIQLKRAGYEVEIYEARNEDAKNEGVFLGLTPNGLNVLKNFISLGRLQQDFTNCSMYFFNSKGKEIASLPNEYQEEKYGSKTIQVKRAFLYSLLHEALVKEGISIRYGKKAISIAESDTEVTVHFSDGGSTKGSLLFGCDGTFSKVRDTVFPNSPKPVYTKNISTGGFCFLQELRNPSAGINMTFGEKGFFAYAVSNNGEIWWFNNYYRENEPTKEEIRKTLPTEISTQLLEIHKNDDPLFLKIITATNHILAYPIYDIPRLEKWHTKRVCLVGDAAHAISPHAGQGASLALEDTVFLCQCLKNTSGTREAFKQYQLHRQPRVEKIIKQARKVGNTKSKPNPIAVWFRDRMLKYFIKAEIKRLDWIYGYSLDPDR